MDHMSPEALSEYQGKNVSRHQRIILFQLWGAWPTISSWRLATYPSMTNSKVVYTISGPTTSRYSTWARIRLLGGGLLDNALVSLCTTTTCLVTGRCEQGCTFAWIFFTKISFYLESCCRIRGATSIFLSCSLNIDSSLDWHVEDTKDIAKFPFAYASAIHFQIFLVWITRWTLLWTACKQIFLVDVLGKELSKF